MTLSLASIERVEIGTGKRRKLVKKGIRHDICLSNTKEKKERRKETNQSIKKENKEKTKI